MMNESFCRNRESLEFIFYTKECLSGNSKEADKLVLCVKKQIDAMDYRDTVVMLDLVTFGMSTSDHLVNMKTEWKYLSGNNPKNPYHFMHVLHSKTD